MSANNHIHTPKHQKALEIQLRFLGDGVATESLCLDCLSPGEAIKLLEQIIVRAALRHHIEDVRVSAVGPNGLRVDTD